MVFMDTVTAFTSTLKYSEGQTGLKLGHNRGPQMRWG